MRIQDLLSLLLKQWKWVLLSLAVALGAAYYYILTTPPTYTRTATLLIKEDSSEGGGASTVSDAFKELGGVMSVSSNISNEMIAMQSPSLMMDVVRRLRLDVSYTEPGEFHRKAVYGAALPVTADMPGIGDEESVTFDLSLSKGGKVELSAFRRGKKKIEASPVAGALGDTLRTPVGAVVASPTAVWTADAEAELRVSRSSLRSAVDGCVGHLSVSLDDETSTVVTLSYRDESPARAEDVLNTLIQAYNENWVREKNQIAASTTAFINERLATLEAELGDVDDDISSFKSEHLVPDVQAASSMYMSQRSEASARITALNNQLYMARYIRDFLAGEDNRMKTIPAISGTDSPTLEALIADYNSRLLQRNSLVANSSEQNPLVVDLDRTLAEMRAGVAQSIDNQIVTLTTQIRALEGKERQATEQIAANPEQAKDLLSVERQQKVKESLYLYLLQKREENELPRSYTDYNTRLITPPRGPMSPTAPKKGNILLAAFAIGLLVPVVAIFLRETTNTKVRGRGDLKGLSVPFLGEIPLAGKPRRRGPLRRRRGDDVPEAVVEEGRRDAANEAFRVLRTNLEFMTDRDRTANVMAVTSFNAGSGKSFISINLAVSLAIKGRKVLLIDGDMRRATVSAYAGSPAAGLSDYLSRHADSLDGLVIPDAAHATLSILPVGTIPPNPAELLSGERMASLVADMRSQYDHVIIDCPPVEIVADTQLIARFADRVLFVVRAGLLERDMLQELDAAYAENRFSGMAVILNATEPGGRYGYKYGYRSGYYYTYGSKSK